MYIYPYMFHYNMSLIVYESTLRYYSNTSFSNIRLFYYYTTANILSGFSFILSIVLYLIY